MFWRQHLLSNFDDIFSCREELLTGTSVAGVPSASWLHAGVLLFPTRSPICQRIFIPAASWFPNVLLEFFDVTGSTKLLCPDDIASFSILPICHCCARLLMAQVLRDLGDRRLVLTFPAEFVQALEEPLLGLLLRKKCS